MRATVYQRWQDVEGGLGGLAARFASGSVAAALAARDSDWEALAGEEDRRLAAGGGTDQALRQSFDDTGVSQASLERPLPAWNRGHLLLLKLGWEVHSRHRRHRRHSHHTVATAATTPPAPPPPPPPLHHRHHPSAAPAAERQGTRPKV